MHRGAYSLPRRIGLTLLANLWSIGLLLLPLALYAAFWLTNVDTVKMQFEESKVYESISTAFATQVLNQVPADVSAAVDPALLEQSVHEVVTADAVQQKIEPLLDANYLWLAGERVEPLLTINFAPEQRAIAERLSEKVVGEYQVKPACSATDLSQYHFELQRDPLRAPCRIEGVETQWLKQQLRPYTAPLDPSNSTEIALDIAPDQHIDARTGLVPTQPPVTIDPAIWQGAYWGLRNGIYVLLTVLIILAMLARGLTGAWVGWLLWMRRPLLSTGIVLFMSAVIGVVLTQTEWLPVAVMSDVIRQSLSYIFQTPLIITAVTAAAYILLAIFVILIIQRRKYYNVRDDAAREAITPESVTASAPRDSSS